MMDSLSTEEQERILSEAQRIFDPDHLSTLRAQVENAVEAGDLHTAEADLRKAIHMTVIHSSDVGLRCALMTRLGEILTQKTNFSEAFEWLQKAVQFTQTESMHPMTKLMAHQALRDWVEQSGRSEEDFDEGMIRPWTREEILEEFKRIVISHRSSDSSESDREEDVPESLNEDSVASVESSTETAPEKDSLSWDEIRKRAADAEPLSPGDREDRICFRLCHELSDSEGHPGYRIIKQHLESHGVNWNLFELDREFKRGFQRGWYRAESKPANLVPGIMHGEESPETIEVYSTAFSPMDLFIGICAYLLPNLDEEPKTSELLLASADNLGLSELLTADIRSWLTLR